MAAVLAAALATPGWTAPRTVSLPTNAFPQSADIAYGPGGTATLAYVQVLSTSPISTVLHVGVIPPGGTYHEQLRVPSTSTAIPLQPYLAEAPNGAAVVGWMAQQGPVSTEYADEAAYRPAGRSTWGTSVIQANAPTLSGQNAVQMLTSISPTGTAAVGVVRYDPTVPPVIIGDTDLYLIQVAVHGPSGAWGAPVQISTPSTSSSVLGLGFDASSNLTAAFEVKLSNGRHTLVAMTRPASNGIWGPQHDITGSDATSDVFGPKLGVGPNGSAVIAFQYVHYAAPHTLDVNAVTRVGASGAWTSPTDLAAGGASSGAMAAGVSPDGRAYVLYTFQGTNSGLDCEGAARTTVGTAFPTTPQCVSPLNFEPGYPAGLGFLGNDAYLAWTGKSNAGTTQVAQATRWLDRAGSPEAAVNLDNPATALGLRSIGPDQQGGMAIDWITSQNQLRAAAWDAGGPSVVAQTIPTKARAGRTTTMSITFADLWSGISGRTTWSFGDHKTGAGVRVRHIYKRPGRYTIRVTSRDRLGNIRTLTFRITVTRR